MKERSGKRTTGQRGQLRRGKLAAAGIAAAAVLLFLWRGAAGAAADKGDREDEGAFPAASSYAQIYERISRTGVTYLYKEYEGWAMTGGQASGAGREESTASADMAGSQAAYSETNVRQEGVDEGDVVKTDGKYLYVCDGDGRSVQIVNVSTLKTAASIQAEGEGEIQEVYADQDRLILLENSSSTRIAEDRDGMYYPERGEESRVRIFDMTDPEHPVQSGSMSQEGSYLTARKVGDWLYLFTSCYKEAGSGEEDVERYIPKINGSLMSYEDIYLPDVQTADHYVLISAVNAADPQEAGDRKGIMLPGCEIYVSGQHAYFFLPEYSGSQEMTGIYCMGIEDGDIWAESAAQVPGLLYDSFSLDEYKGCLRLVTTEWDYERGTQLNHLYVLDKELETIGGIEDIAPGETVKSVRFCQDTGYFVTFRNVDPLFTADLSDPKNPRIVGELKVTGFSSYLHPYQERLLLGIGQEADENSGAVEGYKLSMFDISDPSKVTEEDKTLLGGGYVPGATDYKAVLADGGRNLIGLCRKENQELYYEVYTYEEDGGFALLLTYHLQRADSVDGYINENQVRGLYVGEKFYVVSPAEIAVFDMEQNFENIAGIRL